LSFSPSKENSLTGFLLSIIVACAGDAAGAYMNSNLAIFGEASLGKLHLLYENSTARHLRTLVCASGLCAGFVVRPRLGLLELAHHNPAVQS